MNLLKKNIDIIVIFFLVGFLISDFITSAVYKLSPNSFYRYAGIFKLLFEGIMIAMIALHLKTIPRLCWLILAITVSFVISQFIIPNSEVYNLKNEFLRGNIYFFNRYMYTLVFILFINVVPLKTVTFKKIYKYLEYFLYVNTIALLIGYFFHVEIFRSYEYTTRFGVSGFFSKPGEASYIYIIAIIVNYYLWITKANKKFLIKLLFFIACSLCLGQKKIFLFLLLLSIVHLVHYNRFKKIFRILLPIAFIVFLFFKESVVKAILSRSAFWTQIYEESGLVSTIFSYRDQLLLKAMEYIEQNWSFLNYIFGGLDFNTYKVEFEFIDLYIFLGIAGIMYYLYIVSSYLHNSNFLKRNLIIITFITSLISGGLLLNVTAAILLYITAKFVMIPNNTSQGL